MSTITFLVPGRRTAPAATRATRGGAAEAADPWRGLQVQSVHVGLARSDTALERLEAIVGEDVVVFGIDNGPELILHPETARDLLRTQQVAAGTSRGQAAQILADAVEIAVPSQLSWAALPLPGASRGALGAATLSVFRVVKAVAQLLQGNGEDTAAWIAQKVDAGVNEGVYALSPDALGSLQQATPVEQVPALPAGRAHLVLIHGTFVDTESTFGKLWRLQPTLVQQLFGAYPSILALDHATLGRSPIENALTLAEALPPNAELHLLTHSRGGLVAETLIRVCARPETTEAELQAFSPAEQAALRRLVSVVRARQLRVTRVVRVACPARGTLLASGRLDAFLSVFRWVFERAGVPIAPQLFDLLLAVAAQKSNAEVLPGIAAMTPESALVQWLHQDGIESPAELRVVAGDAAGGSILGWLKKIVADALFWTDHDLVVQTRSMYGGVPRQPGRALFLRAEGGDITHFSYFEAPRAVQAIANGLLQDVPPDYQRIGPESWAGQSSSGVRAARAARTVRATLPTLFLLPGILGSNLKDAEGDRIWLSHRLLGGLERLKYEPHDAVTADGAVELVYGDLIEALSEKHHVVPFGYDWRCPLQAEAERLAQALEAEWAARPQTPIRILAHSMGGLLARTLLLVRPQVWQKLFSDPQTRLVMLGTPNGGSWAPMQVLSGDDTFGNALAFAGAPFQEQKARQLMANMPGFLQLQANLTSAEGLSDPATWAAFAARDRQLLEARSFWHRLKLQLDVYDWGVPSAEVLSQARALRQQLDAQANAELRAYADQIFLVLGQAEFTPDGFVFAQNEGLVYMNAVDGGDGRVTYASARLPGVRTFRLDANHTDLARREAAFGALDQLLTQGTCNLTPDVERTRGAARESYARVPSRPAHDGIGGVSPLVRFPAVATANAPAEPDLPTHSTLHVSLWNGDLRFVDQALLVGHYRSDSLSGTEAILDRLSGGVMKEALTCGDYPDAPGDASVFLNLHTDPERPLSSPRPRSVIVVGLGDEGSLRARELGKAVRSGVLAWAKRLLETPGGAPTSFELAATLLGSGGVGISSASAARAIAGGVSDANLSLREIGWPVCSRLKLIELYLSRATEAWESLRLLEHAEPMRYVLEPHVAQGPGALQRTAEASYRGAQYDLVSTTLRLGKDEDHDAQLEFTVDSQRARAEVHRSGVQTRLITRFIDETGQNARRIEASGSTLFKLLVPPEADVFLRQSSQLLLEVDDTTAPIPWEILDLPAAERTGDGRPWSISAQMVRKLRTAQFRLRPRDATAEDQILVIGEPLCDEAKYPRLPGALAEARSVVETFRAAQVFTGRVVHSERQGPIDILNALNERAYRVVHVAGHGENGDCGGVCLDGDTFLGPREINALRVVPELVFVNCCHLGAGNLRQGLGTPAAFAANVAKSLIQIGVRCVIAAGWAVEDEPARVFAETFYAALLDGHPFADAVARAREAARLLSPTGSTWAAYQCYGDPSWRLRAATASTGVAVNHNVPVFASAASLLVRLQDLAVQLEFNTDGARAQRELTTLDTLYGDKFQRVGNIAEAFGLAYKHAGDTTAALKWLQLAQSAPDSTASTSAAEQFANLELRAVWSALHAHAHVDLQQLDVGRSRMANAIETLQRLNATAPSAARENLLGSAFKRLGRLEVRAGNERAASDALASAALHYGRATSLTHTPGPTENTAETLSEDTSVGLAAALNLIALQAALAPQALDPEFVARIRSSLQAKLAKAPDFASAVGELELQLYSALGARALDERGSDLLQALHQLHARAPAARYWQPVSEQAEFVFGLRSGDAHPEYQHAAMAEKLLNTLAQFAERAV